MVVVAASFRRTCASTCVENLPANPDVHTAISFSRVFLSCLRNLSKLSNACHYKSFNWSLSCLPSYHRTCCCHSLSVTLATPWSWVRGLAICIGCFGICGHQKGAAMRNLNSRSLLLDTRHNFVSSVGLGLL